MLKKSVVFLGHVQPITEYPVHKGLNGFHLLPPDGSWDRGNLHPRHYFQNDSVIHTRIMLTSETLYYTTFSC